MVSFGILHPLNLLTVLSILVQNGNFATVSPKLSKHPVMLVVSFDGFRFDYIDKTEMPALRAIMEEGVSVPYMQAQFPTKTFPNHQSIATGLYPDVHGITDNSLFDPLTRKKLSGYSDDPEFWNYRPDVLPFWIRNEQGGDGRYSGAYMWAGSSQPYGLKKDLLPTYYIPKYNSSIPWETRVETVISWMTNKEKPANIVFLYHNEPDAKGHSFGADGPEIVAEIGKVNLRISYLVATLKKTGIYDKVNLVILSDHGMQTVLQQNIINTTAIVDPEQYHRNGASPLFHIQPKKSSDTSTIYNAFKTASVGKHFGVYKKSELGHLKYGTNRRICDILLLAEPGYGFDDIRQNAAGVYGVHGYDNRSPNMTTIFAARGPVFKKGFKSPTPIENIDLFPMFSAIMKIPIAPNNGSLRAVSDFLVPTATTTAAASSCEVKMNVFGMILSVVYIGLC